MQTRSLKSGVLIVLLAAVGATGGEAGCSSPAEPPPKYPDKASYCDARAHAECNSEVVTNCAASSADMCVAQRNVVCLNEIPPGTTYQPKQAEACINAVAQAFADAKVTNAETKSYGDACLPVFDGASDVGGVCSNDVDCKVSTGLRCILPPGQTSGTCQIPKPTMGGERCDAIDAQCVDGFHCGATKHCDADGAEGDACSADAPCGSAFSCTAMQCVKKLADGKSCTEDDVCANGLCDKAATNAASGLCVSAIIFSPNEPFCVASR